jgi:Repeat of unknown function (DUF6923)
MKTLRLLLCLLGLFPLAGRASAAILYGSTAAGGPGELYVLDASTGAAITDVGPLNDVTGANYPITGLAFHPTTGVLFGSTGNSVAGKEATLVTIDPLTAAVAVIGLFNAGPISSSGKPATMADLSFDAAGNLYGVGSIGGPHIYSINTSTGQATVIGSSALTSASGGGLAITDAGDFYGTPTSSRFGTYDAVTGAFTNIVAPVRPVGGAYAALAALGSTVYGLDLGTNAADTRLVTIDAVGTVVELGASVGSIDAIAFAVPEPGTLSLLVASAVIGLLCKR